MTSEEIINEVNSKVALIKLEFFEKHCKNCIETQLQKERNCAKFKGHNFLCCNKKGNYIKRKMKIKNKEIMKKFVADLLGEHTRNLQGSTKSYFIFDILD